VLLGQGIAYLEPLFSQIVQFLTFTGSMGVDQFFVPARFLW